MNPLMAAGIPGMSGGLSDSSTTASGDVNGRNNNGGAVNFGPSWQGQLVWLGVAAIGLAALYIWKK